MQDTSKYLIHADVTADGVVERSDVVGAIFGQTEGLLGEDLDLRQLQDASKVGRIDVEIESQNGQSFGEITIATNLDKVETATLAAALETITRIGPCRATVEVRSLEDLRSAKRRRIVERAQELLAEAFDDSLMSSEQLIEEVRKRIRVEDVTEYEGLPAGPRVEDSDAVVVVEGRADVLAVLEAGVKNPIAVEGTDVPDAVATLSEHRTTTAFLDGDRGGDLILRELAQVGSVDYVAFAPIGRSVEDLGRHEVLAALRGKVEYDRVTDHDSPHELVSQLDGPSSRTGDSTDGSTPADVVPPDNGANDSVAPPTSGPATQFPARDGRRESDHPPDGTTRTDGEGGVEAGSDAAASGGGTDPTAHLTDAAAGSTAAEPSPDSPATAIDDAATAGSKPTESAEPHDEPVEDASNASAATSTDDAATDSPDDTTAASPDDTAAPSDDTTAPSDGAVTDTSDDADDTSATTTIQSRVSAVVGTGEAVLLDDDLDELSRVDADEAFDAVADADPIPAVVVVDGVADQRLLDVAAQRGVGRIVATTLGEFTKRPTAVRLTDASAIVGDVVE